MHEWNCWMKEQNFSTSIFGFLGFGGRFGLSSCCSLVVLLLSSCCPLVVLLLFSCPVLFSSCCPLVLSCCFLVVLLLFSCPVLDYMLNRNSVTSSQGRVTCHANTTLSPLKLGKLLLAPGYFSRAEVPEFWEAFVPWRGHMIDMFFSIWWL